MKKMSKTLKQLKAAERRAEWKKIEAVLHPVPVIGDIEILHRHVGQYIYFDAWKDDSQIFPMVNYRCIKVPRDVVLFKARLPLTERDIAWLIGVVNN